MAIQNRSVKRISLAHVTRATAVAAAALLPLACDSAVSSSERTATNSEAVTQGDAGAPATINITGTVSDPLDGPQAGITITLAGSAQAQVVTDFSGSFKFSVKPGGSYSITATGSPNFFQPPFHSCLTITPSIINLNNLTTSTNIDFTGAGTDSILNCSPPASAGASSGSLTIQGKVTAGGQPVPGVRVFLNGGAQGFRTTDETGAYSFAVNPGSYSVNPSNTCASFTPTVTNLNNLKANGTANFQGSSCPPAPLTYCPTFDALVGLSEPASCNTVSTPSCESDRLATWAGEIGSDFQFVENANDCRFGKWNVPPIVNDFTSVGFFQQNLALNLFALQLFGCAMADYVVGPLNLQVSLIPPDLIKAGLTFTTADISALEDEYVAAINQALADFGLAPLTATQTTAIRAQLDYAATKVPGVIKSSTLTYSTCL